MIDVVTYDVVRAMSNMGERLKKARSEAGFGSASKAAQRLNMSASTYRAHENGQNDFDPTDADQYGRAFGVRPAWLLTGEEPMKGRGQAPELSPAAEVAPNASYPLPVTPGRRTIPVFGHAAGGMNQDGKFLLNGEKIADVLAPPALETVVGAYAVYHSGDSMLPRYEHGELLTIHPGLPVRKNDYVLVQISGDDGDPPYGYVKRFISLSARELTLEQLNPPEGQERIIRFPASLVLSVHRVFSAGMG